MLSGIYYGAMYGGSTTAILLNVPGESSSVMTAVEGYPLAKQGRGGAALGMSAISSFFAGTVSVVALMFFAPLLAEAALSFGPPEEFALLFAAFTLISTLEGSPLKGLTMGAFGLLVATIGVSEIFSATRMSLGIPALRDGVDMVAVMMGLYALPEVFEGLENLVREAIQKTSVKLRNLIPTKQDFRDSATAFPIGSTVGFIGGILPGCGATASTFLTYAIQKWFTRKPELFGKGSMEALCAVEGANNAASTGALVPMLALGIPGSATTAILIGAMMIHGIQPGPLLFQNSPEVAWGLIASMYIGNVMLLILNLPLITIWVNMMRFPRHVILTCVVTLCVTGVYAMENSIDAVWIMLAFGVFGFILKKLGFPQVPIVLALILTPMGEVALVRSLAISSGSWTIFLTSSYVSAGFIVVALLSVLLQTPFVRRFFSAMVNKVPFLKVIKPQ
jgi:putative tricarboxylic transport membrane protein